MSILITGSAGFIGYHLALRLLTEGRRVIGIDDHNAYYDPALKAAREARLAQFPAYLALRGQIQTPGLLSDVMARHRPIPRNCAPGWGRCCPTIWCRGW